MALLRVRVLPAPTDVQVTVAHNLTLTQSVRFARRYAKPSGCFHDLHLSSFAYAYKTPQDDLTLQLSSMLCLDQEVERKRVKKKLEHNMKSRIRFKSKVKKSI